MSVDSSVHYTARTKEIWSNQFLHIRNVHVFLHLWGTWCNLKLIHFNQSLRYAAMLHVAMVIATGLRSWPQTQGGVGVAGGKRVLAFNLEDRFSKPNQWSNERRRSNNLYSSCQMNLNGHNWFKKNMYGKLKFMYNHTRLVVFQGNKAWRLF